MDMKPEYGAFMADGHRLWFLAVLMRTEVSFFTKAYPIRCAGMLRGIARAHPHDSAEVQRQRGALRCAMTKVFVMCDGAVVEDIARLSQVVRFDRALQAVLRFTGLLEYTLTRERLLRYAQSPHRNIHAKLASRELGIH